MESKKMANGSKARGLFVISIIIAAAGAGLGGYNYYIAQNRDLQGLPGEDGVDGDNGANGEDGVAGIDGIDAIGDPYYICSSQDEIQNAIDTIGNQHGTIFLNGTIMLSSSLDLTQGGEVYIKGWLGNSLIQTISDNHMYISGSESKIIIDAVNFYGANIHSLSFVYISSGTGVIEIKNCEFQDNTSHIGGNVGIDTHAKNTKIYNNHFSDMMAGVMVNDLYALVTENLFYNISGAGISVLANYAICSDNRLNKMQGYGIYVEESFCQVVNNVINGYYGVDKSNDYSGVNVHADSYYNIIDCNIISNFHNSGSGDGIAIQVLGADREMSICNNYGTGVDIGLDYSFTASAMTVSGNYLIFV